jgi:flagellar L-ring protein precursor FlgH
MFRLSISTLLAALALVGAAGFAQSASLYQENTYQPLAADRKARRIGDLLTVLVSENSSATSAANTATGRDAAVGFDLDRTAGLKFGNLKLNNEHEGRGRTQREGRVLAQITVAVQGIAANGDLLIAGQQLLEVNNERQQIKVEGRVRLQDITDANTVLSTRIADAQISYVGDGDVAAKQRPAWWLRFLTWFGL